MGKKMTILDTIADAARERVAAAKQRCPQAKLEQAALAMNCETGFPFE